MSARIILGVVLPVERDRLVVGAGDADDPVAEALDQLLDVHGDQRLVLDDQDVGRHPRLEISRAPLPPRVG